MTTNVQISPTQATVKIALGLVCLLVGGAFIPPSDGQTLTTEASKSEAATNMPQEIWAGIYMQDKQVGHTVFRWARPDEETLRWTQMTVLRMSRFGADVEQRIELTSDETAAGKVTGFVSKLTGGDRDTEVRGQRNDRGFALQTTAGGATTHSELKLDEEFAGFFGVEQSLAAQPMKPGERRELTALVPLVHALSKVRLVARPWEQVALLDGQNQRLLPIDMTSVFGGISLETTYWVNERGHVIKSHIPMLDQTTYLMTKSQALAAGQESMVLDTDSFIQGKNLPRDIRTRAQATYRVEFAKKNFKRDVFPSWPLQTVTLQSDGSLLVRRNLQAQTASWPQPQPGDLASSPYIQADDLKIVEMSHTIAAAAEPLDVAWALQRLVFAHIEEKGYSQVFDTASKVCATRRGDCSEHAVLLAALCRARKIPARVVVGLIAMPMGSRFGFHAWNDVWVGDKWVAMDATLRDGKVGAGHLRIVQTDLAETPEAALLPVVGLFGRDVTITLVE